MDGHGDAGVLSGFGVDQQGVDPGPEGRGHGQVQRNAGDAHAVLRPDHRQRGLVVGGLAQATQDQRRLIRRQPRRQRTPAGQGAVVVLAQRHGGQDWGAQTHLRIARRQNDRRGGGGHDDHGQRRQGSDDQTCGQDQQASGAGPGRRLGRLDDPHVGVRPGDGALQPRILGVLGNAAIGGFGQGSLARQFAIARPDLDQAGQASARGAEGVGQLGASRLQTGQFAARGGQLGLDLLADGVGAAADQRRLGLRRGRDLGFEVGDLTIQFDHERIAVGIAGGGDPTTLAQQHQIVGQGRDLLRAGVVGVQRDLGRGVAQLLGQPVGARGGGGDQLVLCGQLSGQGGLLRLDALDFLIVVANGVSVRQVGDLGLGGGQLIGQAALLIVDGRAVGALEDFASAGDIVLDQAVDEVGRHLGIAMAQPHLDGVGLGHVFDRQVAAQLFQGRVHARRAGLRLWIDARQADVGQGLLADLARAQDFHFGMDDLGAVEGLGIAGRVLANGTAEHIVVAQQDQQARLGGIDRLGQGRGGQSQQDRDQKRDQRLSPVIEDRRRQLANRDRRPGVSGALVIFEFQRLVGQYAALSRTIPPTGGEAAGQPAS